MFTDDDHGDEGGHGDFTLQLSGQSTVKIPSFADNSLPSDMVGGNGHHCSNCDETDYLGPCSGGKGHSYRVNIYARDGKKNEIDWLNKYHRNVFYNLKRARQRQ